MKKLCSVLIALLTFSFAAVAQPNNNNKISEPKNIVVFWAKEFGKDPMQNPNEQKRFNVNNALEELERFYDYYVNQLKLVIKGNSLTDQYKMVLYVIGARIRTLFSVYDQSR